MSATSARVAFGDDALASVAAHHAVGVAGVVRLQPVRRMVGAGAEIHRSGADVEIALRIVTTVAAPPVHVAEEVAAVVAREVQPLVAGRVRVEVTVVDVVD